jgi:hypothetical protein
VLVRWFPLARGPPGGAGDAVAKTKSPASLYSLSISFGAPLEFLTSFLFCKKESRLTTPPPAAVEGVCSRLRYWLCPSRLSAHQNGAGFKASTLFWSSCPFPAAPYIS